MLMESFILNSHLAMLFLDGPVGIPGSQGLKMTAEVFKFTRNEKLSEALTMDATVKPTYGATKPEWGKYDADGTWVKLSGKPATPENPPPEDDE